jgi:phospholipase C
VAHNLFDHTSILRFIEWRWALEPLTVRDATANNLADVLDFSRRNRWASQYAVPPGPFGAPCPKRTRGSSSAIWPGALVFAEEGC